MPLKTGDHLGAGVLIGTYHLTQLFRVELASEHGRVHQVTEQHGELAAFRLGGAACDRRWCFLVSLDCRRGGVLGWLGRLGGKGRGVGPTNAAKILIRSRREGSSPASPEPRVS